MRPGDLELFDTQDLIDELMRRTAFQGVVVHAEASVKDPHWEGERVFRVQHNACLDRDEVHRLLGVVSEYLQWNEP